MNASVDMKQLTRKRDLRIVFPGFLVSIIACLDRVNISYAALTMKQDLGWLTPEIYGAGASIFFFGYLLLACPRRSGSRASCSLGGWSAASWRS